MSVEESINDLKEFLQNKQEVEQETTGKTLEEHAKEIEALKEDVVKLAGAVTYMIQMMANARVVFPTPEVGEAPAGESEAPETPTEQEGISP